MSENFEWSIFYEVLKDELSSGNSDYYYLLKDIAADYLDSLYHTLPISETTFSYIFYEKINTQYEWEAVAGYWCIPINSYIDKAVQYIVDNYSEELEFENEDENFVEDIARVVYESIIESIVKMATTLEKKVIIDINLKYRNDKEYLGFILPDFVDYVIFKPISNAELLEKLKEIFSAEYMLQDFLDNVQNAIDSKGDLVYSSDRAKEVLKESLINLFDFITEDSRRVGFFVTNFYNFSPTVVTMVKEIEQIVNIIREDPYSLI